MVEHCLFDISNMDMDNIKPPRFSFVLHPDRTVVYKEYVVNMYFTQQLNMVELSSESDFIGALTIIMDDCIYYARSEIERFWGKPVSPIRFIFGAKELYKPVVSKYLPANRITGQVVIDHLIKAMNKKNKIDMDQPIPVHFQFHQ